MNTLSVVIGIFAIATVIFVWYIIQPAAYRVIYEAEQFTINQNVNRTESSNLYTMLYYVNDFWAAVIVIIIIAFMLISAQRQDYSSQYEYPPPY